jgi:NADH-quinone oxidoreductase subunit H
MRSASQMISYEISVSMVVIFIFLTFGTIQFIDIVEMQEYVYFVIFMLPLALIFIISGLAEINRLPFDLPEAEAELVSGYNIEYSGITFVFFNIGEYAHSLFLSHLINLIFFGG